eukprot:1317289-Amorphochlora_amoeboformis.AAC.2
MMTQFVALRDYGFPEILIAVLPPDTVDEHVKPVLVHGGKFGNAPLRVRFWDWIPKNARSSVSKNFSAHGDFRQWVGKTRARDARLLSTRCSLQRDCIWS